LAIDRRRLLEFWGHILKFICYKEFNDPEEPIHPGIIYRNKVLPLARVLAVAEAVHPKGLTLPENLFEVVGLLSTYAAAVKELERDSKVLPQIWQEVGVTLAAPLPRPNRIFGIGHNYADHAKETGREVGSEPTIFLKASTTVIASGQNIVYPSFAEQVDYEGELAVVIGLAGSNISEDDAFRHVAGYTIMNDVTERIMQRRDQAKSLPWFRSKSIDTFGPMGPALITADEIKDPHNLEITTELNGEVKQKSSTANLVFKIPHLIAYLSKFFALEPGDVIATGTPAGIGPMKPGDTVTVTIPEIGTLSNAVVSAPETTEL
jgi:2-keto-4-pentenoate hydratase/2-oxohepta-3-ene-1,7-dioic acid hydratase in catechol pathway